MGLFGKKLARAREAWHLVWAHAADMASRRALLACYASILRSVTDATEVQLRLRIAGRVFPFRMRRCDLFTLAEILHERQYELETAVPEAPVIIDAGANVGVSAVWFSARHPGARIHAFEPEPANYRFLELNARGVEEISAHQAALGDANGTVSLRLAAHGAVHSIVDTSVGEECVDVPCVRLDDYCAEHGIDRIDVLKLDVEGFEDRVVDGLGDRLDAVQIVVGELHERFVDEGRFYARLEEHGLDRVRKRYFGDGEAEGVHAFEAARRRE